MKKKKSVIEPIFSNHASQQTNKQQATQQIQPRPVQQSQQSATTPRIVNPVNSTPAPKPQATTAQQSKGSPLMGLGVSISSLTQEKPKEEAAANVSTEVLTETFTPVQLINAWKAFAEEITEEHHLKNTMLNCLPSLLNRDTFEVVVNNPVQEQRLLDSGTDILSRLRSQLRNTQIQMHIRISIENEKKLAFTPSEKFNLMMEENESLRKLKDEFGLELS